MSELGDRVLMTIIVVTAVAGLAGWFLTQWVLQVPQELIRYGLPVVVAVVLFVVLLVTWGGLDLMD